MAQVEVTQGQSHLLISQPHTGTLIPEEILAGMICKRRALQDTDWWLHKLYDFVGEFDATVVRTPYSRSVVDVNRDPPQVSLYPGQFTTSIVPTTTFSNEPIYLDGLAPNVAEFANRRVAYFDPYHNAISTEIRRLRALHDDIIVWDCHSILSTLPKLFDGTLPMFNIGTNDCKSCARRLQDAVTMACAETELSLVVNGRFKGGWITRNYGQPVAGVHSLQMELAQSFYLNEADTETYDTDKFSKAKTHLAAIIAKLMTTEVG